MPVLKNTRHEAFALARVAGMTVDGAYVAAGYNRHRGNAARLSANESIRCRVQELQLDAARLAGIEAWAALEHIAQIAFSDIRDLFDDTGQLLPVGALPDKVAAAVQSIKVTSKSVSGRNSEEPFITVEIRFWDKNAALEKLAKYLHLYDDQRGDKDPAAAFLAAIMDAARPLPVANECDPRK